MPYQAHQTITMTNNKELLIRAKQALDHARKWIKNLQPQFEDTGIYSIVSNELATEISNTSLDEQILVELTRNLAETHATLCFTSNYIGTERWKANKKILLLVTNNQDQYGLNN